METALGHLTYCTNIHAGESWAEHFAALKKHIPEVKKNACQNQPFGIGLRLSDTASRTLVNDEELEAFKTWLAEEDCYVFTLNGFPFGGFHHTSVKDQVHAPDWTTMERVEYSIRLAKILAALLPEGIDGGISTSPLTYRHWHNTSIKKLQAYTTSTHYILQVVKCLVEIKVKTGKLIHLDIEPEPDGLLESSTEFLQWYNKYLLPIGIPLLANAFQYSKAEAERVLKEHVQLCYDICHFAVGYEDHATVIQQLKTYGIRTGKIQISAALKASLAGANYDRFTVANAFQQFNEPVYLHQVVAQTKEGVLKRYNDLPVALNDVADVSITEWRAHYHVPLFIEQYGLLQSTQQDIQEVLHLHRLQPFTQHLEIETYTWEVLPEELKLPLSQSIAREIDWVLREIREESRELRAMSCEQEATRCTLNSRESVSGEG